MMWLLDGQHVELSGEAYFCSWLEKGVVQRVKLIAQEHDTVTQVGLKKFQTMKNKFKL